jgi:2-keto-4-pentenoate hydratase
LLPADAAAARQVAARVAELLPIRVAGWKIGATTAEGQRLLGLDAPFLGQIDRDWLEPAPADIRADARQLALEPEVAVELTLRKDRMRRQIGPGLGIAACFAAVEINRPSYTDPFALGGPAIVADNGATAGAVLARGLAIDPQAMRDVHVSVLQDGRALAEGSGANVLGDPMAALDWFAAALAAEGIAPEEGQIVLTGALTPPFSAAPGRLVARFFGLGDIELTLVPTVAAAPTPSK